SEPEIVGGKTGGGGGGPPQFFLHRVSYFLQHPPPGPGFGHCGLGPGTHFVHTFIKHLLGQLAFANARGIFPQAGPNNSGKRYTRVTATIAARIGTQGRREDLRRKIINAFNRPTPTKLIQNMGVMIRNGTLNQIIAVIVTPANNPMNIIRLRLCILVCFFGTNGPNMSSLRPEGGMIALSYPILPI
ncbi:MAG: hypothetical protein QGM50_10860, partial [Anaerolineae bacterium]|nr:hypothetical protein [Anaerolineae bacterium]